MLWNLVYALYGLTPDDIRRVEESAPSSVRRAEAAPGLQRPCGYRLWWRRRTAWVPRIASI